VRTSEPPPPLIPSPPPDPLPTSVRLSADQSDDEGYSLIQTSDGGYAIAGHTKSFGAGLSDAYLVKLDANGNLQWTKTIGGKDFEDGYSLIQTSDGGYAIAGDTKSFGAGLSDAYLVKLDANGNLQWTTTIGGKDFEDGYSLIQTSDGGYAIAGYTQSFGAGGADVYVVKLDAKGNLQWTKTIGGPKGDDWGQLPHSDLRWRLRHRRLHLNPSAQEVCRCLCRQAGCQW
jgi:hypothetical protein